MSMQDSLGPYQNLVGKYSCHKWLNNDQQIMINSLKILLVLLGGL